MKISSRVARRFVLTALREFFLDFIRLRPYRERSGCCAKYYQRTAFVGKKACRSSCAKFRTPEAIRDVRQTKAGRLEKPSRPAFVFLAMPNAGPIYREFLALNDSRIFRASIFHCHGDPRLSVKANGCGIEKLA